MGSRLLLPNQAGRVSVARPAKRQTMAWRRAAAAAGGDPNWSSVVLLAINDNQADTTTTFDDESTSNNTLTANGNAQYDTAQAPTGLTSSGLFDGTGDALTAPGNTDFAIGTADFAIELWFRQNTQAVRGLFDLRPNDTQGLYPTIYIDTTTVIYHTDSATQITSGAISSATWYHLAVARGGTSTRMFLDGTQTGSTYSDSNSYLQNQLTIGNLPFSSLGYALDGWIAAVRFTNGSARGYTANFTPPTLPLPTS